MVQNNFGPIEGQGITKLYIPSTINTGKELFRTAIWVVKFGRSEKGTKFEKIFHFQFDVTQ